MSTVTDALDALILGRRSIEDVEAEFAQRDWPTDPQAEGSFTEVADAYTAGRIDLANYTRLAEAAAAANRRRHPQEDT